MSWSLSLSLSLSGLGIPPPPPLPTISSTYILSPLSPHLPDFFLHLLQANFSPLTFISSHSFTSPTTTPTPPLTLPTSTPPPPTRAPYYSPWGEWEAGPRWTHTQTRTNKRLRGDSLVGELEDHWFLLSMSRNTGITTNTEAVCFLVWVGEISSPPFHRLPPLKSQGPPHTFTSR